MLLGSCSVKGSLEQLVGMFPTLTHCGGKVHDMFRQLKDGVCSSYKDYPATYKGEKCKEMMWIHHFVIVQLFHPKFHTKKDVRFEHEDSTLFLHKITLDKTQQYINLYHDSPRYEWLWLGRNY